MPWAPAKNNGSCAECLAIARESDELLSPYRYQPQHHLPQVPPVAMAALRRSAQHAARTGHFLSRVSH